MDLSPWPQGLGSFPSLSCNNLCQNLNFKGKKGGRAYISQVSYVCTGAKRDSASMWTSGENSGDLTLESFRAVFFLCNADGYAVRLPETSSLWASLLDCRVMQSLRKSLFCIRTIHYSGKTKRLLRLKIQLLQKINYFNHCSPSPLILSWQVAFILISYLLNTEKKKNFCKTWLCHWTAVIPFNTQLSTVTLHPLWSVLSTITERLAKTLLGNGSASLPSDFVSLELFVLSAVQNTLNKYPLISSIWKLCVRITSSNLIWI